MDALDKRSFLVLGGMGLAGLATAGEGAAPSPGETLPLAARQDAANASPGPRTVPGRAIPVPHAGLSDKAQAMIAQPYNAMLKWNLAPADDDAWRAATAATPAAVAAAAQRRAALGVALRELRLGGVRCYELVPAAIPDAHRNHLVIVAHGGAYVYGAGVTGSSEAAQIAALGGYRTISVDYRMPPDHPAPAAVEDMIAVWRAILADHDPRAVAFAGTSAGGGLVLATMLRAKQLGLAMPGAMAPSSPWADLTETGDSYRTNEWTDNVLVSYSGFVGRAARLYAGGADMRDPLLSPVYGDFHGMPPAMLTSGTRDLFLSNTVRVHRELRRANVTAELQVFEGLSHAQFAFDPAMPEAREVYGEIARFFDRHLLAV